MEEGLIHQEVIFVANDKTAIVAQPGQRAFDFPAFA